MTLPPVCILAGGVGSRLGELVAEVPKPLLDVAGRPFLSWQLELLRSYDAERVVICVGYLGEQIEREIGPDPFGLEVLYRRDPPGLAGTGGAVRGALDLLGDRFLVLYGDTYLRIDYTAVAAAAETSGLPALMTVIENRGHWDRSNATFDGERVHYDKHAPTPEMTWVDYGLSVLTPEALEAAPQATDLADVFAELSRRGRLAGFVATERFHEIGTPAALAETAGFLRDRGPLR